MFIIMIRCITWWVILFYVFYVSMIVCLSNSLFFIYHILKIYILHYQMSIHEQHSRNLYTLDYYHCKWQSISKPKVRPTFFFKYFILFWIEVYQFTSNISTRTVYTNSNRLSITLTNIQGADSFIHELYHK
jgi:hypothetical protein